MQTGGIDRPTATHACKCPLLVLLVDDFALFLGLLHSPGSLFTAKFRIALQCLRWLLCCEHTKVMLPKSCLSPSEKEKG
ncbi:hypothetical protein EPR50_G00225900 [Perca flavescens]|uniref:Uncharacterized protein n=1 Tax=Perca flavescens TaxID=8167 RepID=A0A484C0Z3_PERFV|nr:hypothetical protein EPR50_G00225900 [Perca flavescens]